MYLLLIVPMSLQHFYLVAVGIGDKKEASN